MTRVFAALAALARLAAAADASAATLIIHVEGVRSNQGAIYAGVCATGFGEEDCPYKSREAATVGTVELRIPDVEPGDYAIAVFQDLNGNGRIDRPFFIPTEPFGFSNDVGRRGPPRFEAAKVSVRDPATTVVVSLR
ncbi:MAG: DUF2141 domain-containing protein [Acetobacteraceae bacterium]|nr:DUF2141 domain-containing protein [Acetobacteraceae bacterium]